MGAKAKGGQFAKAPSESLSDAFDEESLSESLESSKELEKRRKAEEEAKKKRLKEIEAKKIAEAKKLQTKGGSDSEMSAGFDEESLASSSDGEKAPIPAAKPAVKPKAK